MRRLTVLVAGLVALLAATAVLVSHTDDAELVKASVGAPPKPAPEPRFTRTTSAVTNLDGAARHLDACKGPIAVFLGESKPTLIAEHDYCGGAAWISRTEVGDAVQLGGRGVDDGLFVVTSLTYETRREVKVGDLPAADAVLQTCVTDTTLVLVALERFEA